MEVDWNAIDRKWQKKWLENDGPGKDAYNKGKKCKTVGNP